MEKYFLPDIIFTCMYLNFLLKKDFKMNEAKKIIENHRKEVSKFMFMVGEWIQAIGRKHDISKYDSDEWPTFEKYTSLLPTMEYGSDEYKQALKDMKPGLDKHYKKNPHHPEYFLDGIEGMDLIQMIEMLVDWYVSSNGSTDIIQKQQSRFGKENKLWTVLQRSNNAIFNVCNRIIMDILQNENDPEVRKIVWDWFLSISIDSPDYPKPDMEKFEKAKNYILILCGNGLG